MIELAFFKWDDLRPMLELVAEPYDQEEWKTNVGHQQPLPVDRFSEEGLIVLTKYDEHTEREGENRTEREEAGTIRQLLQVMTLLVECAPEPIVTDCNPEPSYESAHTGCIQQPRIDDPISEEACKERHHADNARQNECIDWHAALIQLA